MGAAASAVLDRLNLGVNVAQLIANVLIGNEQNRLASEQLNLAEQGYTLDRENTYLDVLEQTRDIDKTITDMQGEVAQIGIDIRDTNQQIDSYDKWLANYQAQYQQEVASKNAQIAQMEYSGKESYENFMNAIGQQDAVSGATGRAGGAGLSQGAVANTLDQQLVAYVGEDRTLDMDGGLYGTQRTAAELEMGQLQVDLGFQQYEAQQNRANAAESLGNLYSAQGIMQNSISESTAAKGDLQKFIEANFGDLGSIAQYHQAATNHDYSTASDDY
jgi:hypothetical protein